ncbi:oligosaccharide flippase family protein, partial [Candidatus Micrarchaeota archaeon]|nr:oligosaccharide flippase family protein [Candidatus Micrarchaeota archaeon]
MEEISEHSKEVAKGSFWSIFGSIVFKLISFLYVILLARAASQEDVGIFYLSLGIVTIVSFVSDLGLPSALIRYVPYYEGKKELGKINQLLKMSYVGVTVVGAVITIILWVGA